MDRIKAPAAVLSDGVHERKVDCGRAVCREFREFARMLFKSKFVKIRAPAFVAVSLGITTKTPAADPFAARPKGAAAWAISILVEKAGV